jgi:hypothetical protein
VIDRLPPERRLVGGALHQTLLAPHTGDGVYVAQYLRPAWPYSLTIFINSLPSENSPYRLNADPHAKASSRRGNAHGGVDGGGGGGGVLPQTDAGVQGRGGACWVEKALTTPALCYVTIVCSNPAGHLN